MYLFLQVTAAPDNELLLGIILTVAFAVIGGFLLRLTRNHRQGLKWQIKLFLIALAVRFGFSIVVYEFGLVNVLGDEDASGWAGCLALMRDWEQRYIGLVDLPGVLSEAFYKHHRGYIYMLGGLFYVTNTPGRLPAAALNCFFGALTVVFTYRVAKSLFSNWVATRVGWAVCFFPSMIVWSAQTVKEPVVILLEVIALYACVHLKLSGFSVRYILLCVAAILLLLPFRFYAAYLAAAAAMLALIIPQLGKKGLSVPSGIAIAALIIPLAISSGILARNQADFEKFDINQVQKFRRDIAAGTGSGVQGGYDLRTTSGLVLGTSVGAAHLLLAPFPWQMGGGSLRMLGTLPEVVVWWWLVFMGLLPGLWYAIKTRFSELQPFLFFLIGLGLLYSMMFGNIGLIVRQRAQLLPLLLVFAMVGLEQQAIKKLLKRRSQAGAPVIAQPGKA